ESTPLFHLTQCSQPPLQKTPLRLLLRKTQSPFVGGSGFGHSSKPPAKIRTRRMSEVVAREIAFFHDGIDKRKPCSRTVAHCHRHRAVQFDHRRRFRFPHQISQRNALVPASTHHVPCATTYA